MMKTRDLPGVQLSKKGTQWVQNGHPWVYETEVTATTGSCVDGELADVFSAKGSYLGTGFYNSHSKIRVRIVSRNRNDTFDDAFWARRLRYCWEYRKTVMGHQASCCRLIFGEADQFPGLTVDRFGDVLVCQVLSLGIERIKHRLLPLLVEVLRQDGQVIHAVYERDDVAIRQLEGMEQKTGYFPIDGEVRPPDDRVQIVENGLHYTVDIAGGQKTGFFLDQKFNRQAVARYAAGKRVLDCFTHTGSFGMNAAMGGACHVTSVDISQQAVEMARENVHQNGLDERVDLVCANVFDLLTELSAAKCRDYDFVILDPPAFTKSRATVKQAYRGYKDINLRAMKLLPRGGYLATCSCSHFMGEGLFRKMLTEAARDAGVSLRQIECRQQSPDHPILYGVPETDYLKFFIFQVV
ncbi:class I SAM-dependent rRNA methyltransferase [Neobittarella massiliensis]|uniref:Class I SAM-dependent rRNA methyltransferase n=1 Tax=Neobittarella massiliensis (ex Bilen et al. 2018) TaxID=2041842 RepID=A0A8J6IJY8_9FIRM|nr:class I SAM-dependent rRNA methyltransferase [Neobittarella massiliensis]MBC3515951.1 class I SAM-dependent rRNA methyltransferase [Neobittarella massiliensis]